MGGFFSWLYGGTKTAEPTAASALNIQSSSQGYPIPILYGKTKVSANLTWYGDFTAIRHEQEVGGKGGGTTLVSYTYTTGVTLGQCEGKVHGYGAAWTGAGKTTVQDLGFTEFYGDSNQAAWNYLNSAHPEAALNYKNFAYLANATFDLGTSPNLPVLWFEVNGATPFKRYYSDVDWCTYNPEAQEFWGYIAEYTDPPPTPPPIGTIVINRWSGINASKLTDISLTSYFTNAVVVDQWAAAQYDYSENCIWAHAFCQHSNTVEETVLYKLNPITVEEISHFHWHTPNQFNTFNPNNAHTSTRGYNNGGGGFYGWHYTGTQYARVATFCEMDKVTFALTPFTYVGLTPPLTGHDYSWLDANGFGWCTSTTGVYPTSISMLLKFDFSARTITNVRTFTALTDFEAKGIDVARNNLIVTSSHFSQSRLGIFSLDSMTFGAELVPQLGTYDYGDLGSYDSYRDWFWSTGYNDNHHIVITAYALSTNTEVFSLDLGSESDGSLYYPFILSTDSTYPYVWLLDSNNPYGGFPNALTRINPNDIGGDADPADVIQDFLTNSRYGAGFPSASLDTASLMNSPNSYANYTQAQNIGFSVLLSQQAPARETLANWLAVTNTAVFWSEGKLKFKPFGDVALSYGGIDYVPDNIVEYNLGDSDFIVSGDEDPIIISRPDSLDCYNTYQLKVLDKNNEYNYAVVESQDLASVYSIGIRLAPAVEASFISTPEIGRLCVELMKNRGLYVRNHFTFKLAWEYVLLEPMDIVTLTQSDMGLNQLPVRILSITEDADGILEFEAEEYLQAVQYAYDYNTQVSEATQSSGYTPPTDTFTPVIFEPPYSLIKNVGAQVWVAAGGAAGTWGGCQVWVSIDGENTYSYVGSITGGSPIGVLTATLPTYVGANPDDTNTLSVNLTTSGSLQSYSTEDAQAFRSLSYVDGELLSFRDAYQVGDGLYDAYSLYRGAYGTTVAEHLAATQFARLDSNVLRYTFPTTFTSGQQIYVKLPAFNVIGNAVQGLDIVAGYPYTITNVGNHVPFFLSTFVSGVPPINSPIYTYIATHGFLLPTDLAGTSLTFAINPSSPMSFSVDKNGVSFGTINVSTLGVVTLTATATSFAIGDTFSIITPADLFGIADIAFSIAGTAQ